MTTRAELDDWEPVVEVADDGDSALPSQITQAMLMDYEELKLLDQRRRQLRDELLSRLLLGAQIEPGPLRVEIGTQTSKIISFAKLCAIGGPEWAADVRRRVEPTVSYKLIITCSDPIVYANQPRYISGGGPIPNARDNRIYDLVFDDELDE